MAKKKAKQTMCIVFPDGSTKDIVREDGKYWYTKDSQYRKSGPFVVEAVKEAAADERKDEETEG